MLPFPPLLRRCSVVSPSSWIRLKRVLTERRAHCSYTSTVAVRCESDRRTARHQGGRRRWAASEDERQQQQSGSSSGPNNGGTTAAIPVAFAATLSGWLLVIKDYFGIEPAIVEPDEIKCAVKKAIELRRNNRLDEAIELLQSVMTAATERESNEPLVLTKVLEELGHAHLLAGHLDEAEKLLRTAITRQLKVHGTTDRSPQFVSLSLLMIDVLIQRGLLDDAEAGLTHCLQRQIQIMSDHRATFTVAGGALMEERFNVDTYGARYTDPVAMMGMICERFALFLVEHRGENRLEEADQYINEAVQLSSQVTSATHPHTIRLLYRFGASCVGKERWQLAHKYLSIGAPRILYIDDCADILPSYYCNYACALFHLGRGAEAWEWATKALPVVSKTDTELRAKVQGFIRFLERRVPAAERQKISSNTGTSSSSWWRFWA